MKTVYSKEQATAIYQSKEIYLCQDWKTTNGSGAQIIEKTVDREIGVTD